MNKPDLALNYLQWLMGNQTKPNNKKRNNYYMIGIVSWKHIIKAC